MIYIPIPTPDHQLFKVNRIQLPGSGNEVWLRGFCFCSGWVPVPKKYFAKNLRSIWQSSIAVYRDHLLESQL
jgi:hypothetical protein